MDARSVADAFGAMIVGLIIIAGLGGAAIATIGFLVVPWVIQHLSVAWN